MPSLDELYTSMQAGASSTPPSGLDALYQQMLDGDAPVAPPAPVTAQKPPAEAKASKSSRPQPTVWVQKLGRMVTDDEANRLMQTEKGRRLLGIRNPEKPRPTRQQLNTQMAQAKTQGEDAAFEANRYNNLMAYTEGLGRGATFGLVGPQQVYQKFEKPGSSHFTIDDTAQARWAQLGGEIVGSVPSMFVNAGTLARIPQLASLGKAGLAVNRTIEALPLAGKIAGTAAKEAAIGAAWSVPYAVGDQMRGQEAVDGLSMADRLKTYAGYGAAGGAVVGGGLAAAGPALRGLTGKVAESLDNLRASRATSYDAGTLKPITDKAPTLAPNEGAYGKVGAKGQGQEATDLAGMDFERYLQMAEEKLGQPRAIRLDDAMGQVGQSSPASSADLLDVDVPTGAELQQVADEVGKASPFEGKAPAAVTDAADATDEAMPVPVGHAVGSAVTGVHPVEDFAQTIYQNRPEGVLPELDTAPLGDYNEHSSRLLGIPGTEKMADGMRTYGDRWWKALTDRWQKIQEGNEMAAWLSESRGQTKEIADVMVTASRMISGQQQRVMEDVVQQIAKLTPEDQRWVAEQMQLPNTDPRHPLAGLAKAAREEFVHLAVRARNLGLLSDDTFYRNVGQYFPFMYKPHELQALGRNTGVGARAALRLTESERGAFHARMTDEERVAYGIRHGLIDVPEAKREALFKDMPPTPGGLAPDTRAEDITGIFSPEEIKYWAEETNDAMGLIREAAYPIAKRSSQLISAVYKMEAANDVAKLLGPQRVFDKERLAQMIAEGTAPPRIPKADISDDELRALGYQFVDNDRRKYGDLAGKWVPKGVHEMLGQMNQSVEVVQNAWERFILPAYKTSKVALSPSVQVQNMASNALLSWLADVTPRQMLDGVREFISHDEVYKQLRNYGLFKRTYAAHEMKALQQSLAAHGEEGTIKAVYEWASKLAQKPGELYGGVEDAFKMAVAVKALREGASPKEAVNFAHRWLFDYGHVSKAVEMGRKFPFPFITFTAKVAPRMLETIVRKPWKLAEFYVLMMALNHMTRWAHGLSVEQEEFARPKEIGHAWSPFNTQFLTPFKDGDGNLQWVDLSRATPWGGLTDRVPGTEVPMPTWLQVGNPLQSMLNVAYNYDPYFGQEIAPDYLTQGERVGKLAAYAGKSLLPDWTPVVGASWNRVAKAASGEPNYTGINPGVPQAVVQGLTGFRTTKGSAATTGAQKFAEEAERRAIEANRPAVEAGADYYTAIILRDAGKRNISDKELEELEKRFHDRLEVADKAGYADPVGLREAMERRVRERVVKAPVFQRMSRRERALYWERINELYGYQAANEILED